MGDMIFLRNILQLLVKYLDYYYYDVFGNYSGDGDDDYDDDDYYYYACGNLIVVAMMANDDAFGNRIVVMMMANDYAYVILMSRGWVRLTYIIYTHKKRYANDGYISGSFGLILSSF
jgi:hypothetical protein